MADCRRNSGNHRLLKDVLVLEHHPYRPFPYLGRVPSCSCHDSLLSTRTVSGNTGAVQKLIRLTDLVKYASFVVYTCSRTETDVTQCCALAKVHELASIGGRKC